jgi:hypothetical protein
MSNTLALLSAFGFGCLRNNCVCLPVKRRIFYLADIDRQSPGLPEDFLYLN